MLNKPEHVRTDDCASGVPFDRDDRFVVYTCVTHGYDNVPPIDTLDFPGKFVCFSNRPDKVANGWLAQPLQSPRRLRSGHDINRFHKIFPHRLFPAMRFSVYIDGNVHFSGDFEMLIERLRASGRALAAFSHPDGRSIEEESDACAELGKFDFLDMARSGPQLHRYSNDGFDLSEVVTANYLLVRDHCHPLMETTMSLWWSHLFEFTKRDQLSLNYVLWKTGLPWVYLDKDFGIDPSGLVRYPHHGRAWNKAARRIANATRKLAGYFG